MSRTSTIWHIGSQPPTTRQKCRSKKNRTTAPRLRPRPKAAGRRWLRNTRQSSPPAWHWRAGRTAVTYPMYIASNINYRCEPRGTDRPSAISSPGSRPVAFINPNWTRLIALSPTSNRSSTARTHRKLPVAAQNENDGIAPSFPSRLGLQLEELNSLETARMRVCNGSGNVKIRLVACRWRRNSYTPTIDHRT